jgi:hypothetical protein
VEPFLSPSCPRASGNVRQTTRARSGHGYRVPSVMWARSTAELLKSIGMSFGDPGFRRSRSIRAARPSPSLSLGPSGDDRCRGTFDYIVPLARALGPGSRPRGLDSGRAYPFDQCISVAAPRDRGRRFADPLAGAVMSICSQLLTRWHRSIGFSVGQPHRFSFAAFPFQIKRIARNKALLVREQKHIRPSPVGQPF